MDIHCGKDKRCGEVNFMLQEKGEQLPSFFSCGFTGCFKWCSLMVSLYTYVNFGAAIVFYYPSILHLQFTAV